MKYVASCSCSKDSLAMVLCLIEKKLPLDMVVMFDLGKEFDSIYATWDKLTDILDKNNIEYSVVKADYDYYFDQKPVNCKNGMVKMVILGRICNVLYCDFGDIMEYIKEEKVTD